MTDIAQVNRILDRTCKKAGLDPVAVRVAMINAIKDKHQAAEMATVGRGYSRLPPMRERWLSEEEAREMYPDAPA